MKAFVLWLVLISGLVCADVIDDLKPGQWLEIPNSKLYDVRAPQDSFSSALCGGIEGIGGIINDWCSGAFDTKRSRLLIGPGGGHHGYSGNEVYAFDINTLKWLRLTDPNPLTSCSSERPNPDSFPGAMHTYDGLEYMPPPLDRHVVVDLWGGYPVRTFYSLDMTTLAWKAHKAMPGLNRTGDVSAYDTTTRRFFYGSAYSGQLVEWDPVADTCLRLLWAGPFYYQNASIDPKRHYFVSVGHAARTHAIPITAYPEPIIDRTPATSGAVEFETMTSPGLDYDAVADKMVGWSMGAGVSKFDVYTLDLDENAWTRHTPSLSNTVTPGDQNQWGTWGRWRYVPSKNVFVVYNYVQQNVFIYRFTSWRDTMAMDSITVTAPSASIEQFLTLPLAVVAYRVDGSSDTVSNSCTFVSLDTAIAKTNGFYLTAYSVGTARIAVRKSTAKGVALDTLSLPVVASTALADSIRIAPDALTLLAGQHYQLNCTGYFFHAGQFVSRSVSSEASWNALVPGIVNVVNGELTALAPGSVRVVAVLDGRTDTLSLAVRANPAAVIRVNFGTSAKPFAFGWYADNAIAYDAAEGRGWVGAVTGSAARDDRGGDNYLLRSFVYSAGSSYRVDVPEGNYIIKYAVGDNQYGGDDTVWYGTNRLLTHTGSSNQIKKDSVTVSGNGGLLLKVSGKINYLVVITNQGIDIDSVAMDLPPFTDPDTLPHLTAAMASATAPLALSAVPNPFSREVTFRLKGAGSNGLVKLSIVDVQGRLIHQSSCSGQKAAGGFTWAPKSHQSGIVFARVETVKGTFVKRLLIIK